MKKLIFILSIFTLIYSCTKKELTPPVVIKLTADDSMRLGLLKIGQQYQGGIIAYILVSGDPGYDANKKHGIIAAISDQSTNIMWWNGSDVTTGAKGLTIGTGLVNTTTIISKQGPIETNYAAGLAKAYKGGGYTDWFLPSKDELNKLYLNRNTIGGFANNYYWSSSENTVDSFNAWRKHFNTGYEACDGKSSSIQTYVRAIRSF